MSLLAANQCGPQSGASGAIKREFTSRIRVCIEPWLPLAERLQRAWRAPGLSTEDRKVRNGSQSLACIRHARTATPENRVFCTTPPSHTIGACPCAIGGIRGEPRSVPERLWPSRFRHGPGSPDPGYRRNEFIRVDSCPFVVPTRRFRSDPPASASIGVDPWLPLAKPCRGPFRPAELRTAGPGSSGRLYPRHP